MVNLFAESRTESEANSAKSDDPGSSQDDAPGRLTLPTVSNYNIGDHQAQPESSTPIVSEKLGQSFIVETRILLKFADNLMA